MSSTEEQELMNLAIDGRATAGQMQQLDGILLASPEARETFDGLRRVTERLKRLPILDPPGVKETVMRLIRPRPRIGGRRGSRRYVYAFAYAAAAIVVIAFAIHRVTPAQNDAAATMIRRDALPLLGQVASAQATMTVRGASSDVWVEVHGNGPFTVEWDGMKLAPSEAAAAFPKGGKPARLQLLRLPNSAGTTVIRLMLPEKKILSATIELR